jgi:hypothetical protein
VRAVDAKGGKLLVDFDGREVSYDFGELDALVLAYATTVLPVTTQHWGCVGVSAAVYANRGFELCAAWPIVVQKSSRSYRDGRAVRDGVPGRIFWHRQPAEAAVQGGSVRGLRSPKNGSSGLLAMSARLGVQLRHGGIQRRLPGQTSLLAGLAPLPARVGYRVSVHGCRDSRASPKGLPCASR